MNNGDRVFLARLEERMIAMQGDVREIKSEMKSVKGCIHNTEKFAIKTRTILTDHLEQENKRTKMMAIGVSFLAVIVSIILKLVLR